MSVKNHGIMVTIWVYTGIGLDVPSVHYERE